MDKRRDRRHHGPAKPASPWKLILGVIGLLYVLFLVRVNVWTSESTANAISGGTGISGNIVHAKGAALIHNQRDLEDKQQQQKAEAKPTAMPPKPQLRVPPEKPTQTVAVAAKAATAEYATTKPPAYLDALKSTLTSMPEIKKTEEKEKDSDRPAPMQGGRSPPADNGNAAAAQVDAQAPTEPVKAGQAKMTTVEEMAMMVEEKAAHDHEAEDVDADAEAPIHLAVASTPSPTPSSDGTATTPSPSGPTFEERHDVISGYEQTKEYLQNYKRPVDMPEGEGLFLFFTCSDDDGNPHDWSTLCTEARKKVYDLFTKSPAGNRLVTIRAGSEEFWEYRNAFSNDRDLRVKSVPCIMKWEGKSGATSGMMVGTSLLYEPFVRYLFKNVDKPDQYLKPDATHSKYIITLSSRDEYDAYMTAYRNEPTRAPLYLFFVSGRIADNNRPWCPYCRFSEIPAEYSFYAFAPQNARLVRIEVTKTYKEWKQPNLFNTDPVLSLRGVPGFFRILPAAGGSDELVYQRIIERFDLMETWRGIYEGTL
ncbi:hypothetical protein Gpo141_00001357 [Globisporangium polare]